MGIVQLIVGLLVIVWGALNYVDPVTAAVGGRLVSPAANALMIIGATTVFWGGLRTFIFAGPPRKKKPNAAQRERIDDLFLRATAAMVAADERIGADEIDMLTSLAVKFRSRDVSRELALKKAKAARRDRGKLLGDLRAEQELMSEEDKEQMLRACLWIAMADLQQDERELALLKEISEALALAPEKAGAIQASLSNAARALVAAAAGGFAEGPGPAAPPQG